MKRVTFIYFSSRRTCAVFEVSHESVAARALELFAVLGLCKIVAVLGSHKIIGVEKMTLTWQVQRFVLKGCERLCSASYASGSLDFPARVVGRLPRLSAGSCVSPARCSRLHFAPSADFVDV